MISKPIILNNFKRSIGLNPDYLLNEEAENTINEEGHDYTVEWKVGDEIDLPVVGKCRVEEINVQPKKIYKNPWVCSSTDFVTFEPQKLFLKTTHKPQSIGKNAMILKTLDSFGDSILMYQYRSNNNKVYTQYAYMT
jgi:hypothetical protein